MELYQKYVGHDNNRDSYMLNVIESRVIQRTWREWEPQIIYVQHQSSPFPTRIWLPPFADPVGLRVPPIMAREVNAIGTRIAEELDAHGKPGAVSQLETYDAWYPGYIDYMPMYQNIAAWWTETQGGNCATPRTTTVDSLPRDYADLRPTSLYTSPWAEGTWRLRDAVDYMVTADIATLDYAAKFKSELLYNRYQSARNTIQAVHERARPYAYIIPQAQHDPVAPVELLRRMAFMGVRVEQLDRDVDVRRHDAIRRARGSSRWIRSTRSSCASCSSRRTIPTSATTRRTTPPDGRCRIQMDVNVVEGTVAALRRLPRRAHAVAGKAVDWHTDPERAVHDERRTRRASSPPPGEITGSGRPARCSIPRRTTRSA